MGILFQGGRAPPCSGNRAPAADISTVIARDDEEEHEEESQAVAEEVVEEVHTHEGVVEAEVSIEGAEEEVAAAALAAAEEMAALHIGDD